MAAIAKFSKPPKVKQNAIFIKKQRVLGALGILPFFLGIALSLSGCGGGGKSDKPTPVERHSDISTLIQGYNPDTGQSKPLANALFFSGASKEVFAKSNTSGFARLSGFGAFDRLLLNIGASGYALQNIVVNVTAKESLSQVDVVLLRMQNATTFSASDGLVKSLDSGTKVDIAPNTLERADGESITDPNNFRLYVTDIDVNNEALLPADLKTKKEDKLMALEALAAIHVQLDENKASLSGDSIERQISRSNLLILKDNAQIEVAIPITTPVSTPDSVMLYYYDPLTSFWEEAGNLTKSTDGKTYVGKTDKVGYLAALKPLTNTTTLNGCVEDTRGNPISRARIYLKGTSYAGVDNQVADAKGRFSSTVKSAAQASVFAQIGQFKSTEIKVDTSTQSTLNGGNCLVIDTTTSKAAVNGGASWQSPRNFDINILLPNGDIMFYGNRTYNAASAEAVRITENDDDLSESIKYSKLMKGRHFIAINRFFDQDAGGITSNSASVSMADKTFTPPTGEIADRTSQLSDDRTHVWLAAVMDVDDECNITISTPSELSDVVTDSTGNQVTKTYRNWLNNDDFINKKLYEDGARFVSLHSDSSYC